MAGKKENNKNRQSPDIIVARSVAKTMETVAGAVAKAVHKLPEKTISSIVEKVLKNKEAKRKENKK